MAGTETGSHAGSKSSSSSGGGGVAGRGGSLLADSAPILSFTACANSLRCFSRCFGRVPSFKFSSVSLYAPSQQLVKLIVVLSFYLMRNSLLSV